MTSRRRPQLGLALILVLWLGVLLSVVATAAALESRSETRLARTHLELARAQTLAEGGIVRALAGLLERERALRWRADGTPYELAFDSGDVVVMVRSERGKVDLNGAPEDLLRGLFAAAAERLDMVDAASADDAASAVIDWRDADERAGPGGAEASAYAAAGLAWRPTNGPFGSVGELGRVLGVSPELFRELEPVVTVHGAGGRLDPQTVTALALTGVPGIDAATAESFIEERTLWAQAESEPATAFPMHHLSGLERYLARGASAHYTVVSVARTKAGYSATRSAIVRLTGKAERPAQYVAWSEFSL